MLDELAAAPKFISDLKSVNISRKNLERPRSFKMNFGENCFFPHATHEVEQNSQFSLQLPN